MKNIASALILLALSAPFAAGCGGEEATSAGPVPSVTDEGGDGSAPAATGPSETTGPTGTDTEPDSIGIRRFQLWFTEGDALALRWVEAETSTAVATEALKMLLEPDLEGVDTAIKPVFEGVDTAIPPETRLLGVDLDNGIATVDLSSEFESGGGSRSMFMRLAQVVYTVTQFPTVKAVQFHLDGEPVDVFSAEGIVLDKPVTRKDYEELLPAIVVVTPTGLDPAANPIEIRGTANVFEANVTVRLVGTGGRELAKTFTTATCGTGCRGTFSLSLSYEVDKAQKGLLILSDDDADGDGTPQHEARVAVELLP